MPDVPLEFGVGRAGTATRAALVRQAEGRLALVVDALLEAISGNKEPGYDVLSEPWVQDILQRNP